jgi:hypothetical protein
MVDALDVHGCHSLERVRSRVEELSGSDAARTVSGGATGDQNISVWK